jgi:hypothetical protein
MGDLGEFFRAAIAQADFARLSGESRKAVLLKAAHWLEALQDAGPAERAGFVDWICEAPHHLGAFLAIHTIDPALREIGAERLRQAQSGQGGREMRVLESPAEGTELSYKDVSAGKWENLKNHPLVIMTGAVIVAAGASWTVADAVMVKPLEQQLELLKSQLMSHRDAGTGAVTRDQAPGKSGHSPTTSR